MQPAFHVYMFRSAQARIHVAIDRILNIHQIHFECKQEGYNLHLQASTQIEDNIPL